MSFPSLFVDVAAGFPAVAGGSVAWGDYDNDGRLDAVLTGLTAGGSRITHVYRNDGGGVFTDVECGAAWGERWRRG